jgi:hypothetical protein
MVCREECPEGVVGPSAFVRIFTSFRRKHPISTSLSDAQFVELLHRLFNLFDRDGNGVVDHRELLAGLSVLCTSQESDPVRRVGLSPAHAPTARLPLAPATTPTPRLPPRHAFRRCRHSGVRPL